MDSTLHAPQPRALTRVALVGAGYIAEFHLEVLAATPGVALLAVCDTDLGRAQAAALKHKIPHAVANLEELPALGVELVHLTVPPGLHVSLARQALDLGLGVFLEKPMALCAKETRELVSHAQELNLPLAVNLNNVFHPTFVRLTERLAAGEVGKVQHVRVCLSVPLRQLDAGDYTHWMFRAPGHIVFEQATHPLSQIERLLGSVQQVETTLLGTRELHPGQVFHDRWLVAAQGERGTAELYLAFGQPFTRCTVEVLGTDGSLEADLMASTLVVERKTQALDFWNTFLAGRRRAREILRDSRRGLWNWSLYTLGLGPRRDAFFAGMRESIQAFHKALHSGTTLPGSGEQAIRVADWCDAVASAVSMQPTSTPQLPEPGPAREGEVVLTGATGFIGRQVVQRLLQSGTPVTAITRRRHSLPPEILEPALDGRLRLFEATLDDEPGLQAALQGARVCVHLATGGGDDWETVQEAMVNRSRRLAELCADAEVQRFIYVSSVAALYAGPDAGVSEIDDSYPTDPRPGARPIYARGKIAAEKSLREFGRRTDMEMVIARPGVVMGAGTPLQHSGLGLWVRDNHCVGWGQGEHPLPLVWVRDVADGLARAALHPGPELSGRAFNLCARTSLTARAVVEALAQATGRDLHFHPRSLLLSQTMEIGKWIVKRLGGRRAPFPAYRDLKSRALAPPFRSEIAREVLGWTPVEDTPSLLKNLVDVYAEKAQDE
jgi:predicted dehydrogenase/nucleoside-diphosphate-sugar epimerase